MKNRKQAILILLVFIIFAFSPLFPQQRVSNQQDFSEAMALKLKQKLLLSDEQTAKVKIIISNYLSNFDNNNLSANEAKAENEIESLLSEKQREKFKIIADDFFDEINKSNQAK